MEIKLIDCCGDLTYEDFEKAERLLGITFPKSFKKLLYGCDKGHIVEGSIRFFDKSVDRIDGSALSDFLSFKPQEELEIKPWEIDEDALIEKCDKIPKPALPEIVEENLNPPEYFSKNLIIFSFDGCGNAFCFDYRGGKDNPDPPVVFWAHEAAGMPNAISPIADNFESFIAMLKSYEDAEAEFAALQKQHAAQDE